MPLTFEDDPYRSMSPMVIEGSVKPASLAEYLRSKLPSPSLEDLYKRITDACEKAARDGYTSIPTDFAWGKYDTFNCYEFGLARIVVARLRAQGCRAKTKFMPGTGNAYGFRISWALPWWKLLFGRTK